MAEETSQAINWGTVILATSLSVVGSIIVAFISSYINNRYYPKQKEKDLEFEHRNWRLKKRWDAYHEVSKPIQSLLFTIKHPYRPGVVIHRIFFLDDEFYKYMRSLKVVWLYSIMIENETLKLFSKLDTLLEEAKPKSPGDKINLFDFAENHYQEIEDLRYRIQQALVNDMNNLYNLDKDFNPP